MKLTRLAVLAAAALAICAIPAFADTFNVTANGGGVNFNATVNGTPSGTPNVFDVTSISGTVVNNGVNETITGLIPDPNGTGNPGNTPSGYFTIDNLLYTNGGPAVDLYGIGFFLTGGSSTEGNLFYQNGNVYYENNGSNSMVSVAVSPVPEPSSMLLFGSGLALVGLFGVRRFAE